jgi:nitrogen fixation protein NifB
MGIQPYIEELAKIDVSHVTITVCAVDPEIGQQIYSWVRDDKIVYRGRQAAELLLSRQLQAIRTLKEHGVTVKVNCIVIPGINDHHVEAVARRMQELGVDLLNCMAMFPNVNTPFGHLPQPGKEMMERIRADAETFLPQMRHCTRCRADAVGLLDDDKSDEFRGCLSQCSRLPAKPSHERPYIGVATREGVLINQHCGEARSFQIWEAADNSYRMVEERTAPAPGGGIKRWHQLARVLNDCRAVLTSGIGEAPFEILQKSGIEPVGATGFIEDGLSTVYENKKKSCLKGRQKRAAGGGCGGTGSGCD